MTQSGEKDEALEGEILGRDETALPKRTHWAVYLSLALTLFIGGIFAAPFGERAMVIMGLLDEEKPSTDAAPFIKQAEALIAAQNKKIESLSEVLAALEKYETAQNDEVQGLARRIRALEVRPLSQAGEGIVAKPVDLEPLLARIAALETHSTHPIDFDLSAVEARLAALEQRETQAFAATDVAQTLEDMKRAADHRATVEALAVEYTPLIAAAMRADARGTDAGLWSNLKGWAKSLVVVRPMDNLEGDALAAHLGRAERALNEGTLSGLGLALEELQGVEGAARVVLDPWLAKAKAVYAMSFPVDESGASE